MIGEHEKAAGEEKAYQHGISMKSEKKKTYVISSIMKAKASKAQKKTQRKEKA